MTRLPPLLAWIAGMAANLGVIAGICVALLCLAARLFPLLDGLNHFQAVWFAAGLGVLALALASDNRACIVRAGWLAALHAFLFLAPVLRLPAWPGGAGTGTTLKIMTFNAFWYRQGADQIAEFLVAEKPDIVVLQELRSNHADRLNELLRDTYPHRLMCGDRQGCDGTIFSRRPWLQANSVVRGENAPPSMTALFEIGGGRRLRVVSTHMWNPRAPNRQHREIEWLGAELEQIGDLKIVAGDFNLTPWTFALARFERQARVVRGDGIAGSWPASRYWPTIFPIDHIFASPEIRFVSVWRGPRLGSDHLPTIATVIVP